MSYIMKPLSCDPSKLIGLSEKLVVSHYENNYGGAVKRLNAISEQVHALNFASAPVFVINGLKREELIAANSMILHEVYFESLGGNGDEPDGALRRLVARDGRDEGIFFSCRPPRAQQRGTNVTINACASLVERQHLNACNELVQDRKALFDALRQ